MSQKQGNRREKYRKIPLKIKVLLLKKIIEDGQSIKKVATQLKINYSTAKTLYRNQKLQKGKCSLTELGQIPNSNLDDIPITQQNQNPECGYIYVPLQMEGSMPEFKVEASFEERKTTRVQIISKVSFPNIF